MRKNKFSISLESHKTRLKKIRSLLNLTLKLMLLIILLCAFYFGERALLFFLFNSSYFAIKKIEIYGLSDTSKIKLKEHKEFQHLYWQNLFLVDRKCTEEVLESIPPIKSVRIKKRFPEEISIFASERSPEIIVSAGKFYWFDEEGFCIGKLTKGLIPPDEAPIISGLNPLKIRIGRKFPENTFKEGRKIFWIIQHSDFKGTKEISNLHYDEKIGWSFFFNGGAEIRLGKNNIISHISKMDFLYQTINGFQNLLYADLRFENQIPYRLVSKDNSVEINNKISMK